ncbi:MAG TPA: gluconate 2-dehydrogenase subunit 3 family protein [Terriglobales bacterium]|nr:gluconate 2-dehydrogenase subunit 3 family protein [Terriglobales bacterium]
MSLQKPRDVSDEFTRRQWLLKLGQAAAVAGFSGVVPELATVLANAEGQQMTGLPPGLYYPSADHLGHALGHIGSIRAIPRGSETDYIQLASSPFHPQFFSDQEFQIVKRIVDILLGKVNPGALSQTVQWLDLQFYSLAGVREAALHLDPLHRALAVAYYGEGPVREMETADPQTVVRSGIAALQQLSNEQYGEWFEGISESQQSRLITTVSTSEPDTPVRKLFEVVRTEAIRGYYTSADGLRELDYKGNWYNTVCPGCNGE